VINVEREKSSTFHYVSQKSGQQETCISTNGKINEISSTANSGSGLIAIDLSLLSGKLQMIHATYKSNTGTVTCYQA